MILGWKTLGMRRLEASSPQSLHPHPASVNLCSYPHAEAENQGLVGRPGDQDLAHSAHSPAQPANKGTYSSWLMA